MRKVLSFGMLMAVALAAYGQDWELAPSYGQVELQAGFSPDPFRVELVAGGSVDIGELGYVGYVAEAPDFDLQYRSGGYPLTIKVENVAEEGDTMLLINDPSGEWHFVFNATAMTPPSITFPSPQDGLYDIWVGTLHGDFVDAELVITELE